MPVLELFQCLVSLRVLSYADEPPGFRQDRVSPLPAEMRSKLLAGR